MIAYVYVRTDRQTKDKKKRMFTTSKCSHLFFCIVYIHISNGYNAWTALSNSHPRSLLASIYPFRIKIKPKHLASYFHLFLLEYASNYFAYTFNYLKSLYMVYFLQKNVFLYVVMQMAPTCDLWQTLDSFHYYIHQALDLVN